MTLESLFAGKNPQDFYIGQVTQVYRSNCVAQVENFDLMSDRSKFNKSLQNLSIMKYGIFPCFCVLHAMLQFCKF